MLSDFISLFFPKYCLACHQAMGKGEKWLCLHCDYSLPATNSHYDQANYIAVKFYGKVQLNHALAYLKFRKGGKVQRLLHQLKYNDQPELGIYLGEKYGTILQDRGFHESYDLIVPVPLHRTKLKTRGYNQSTMFAQGLANKLLVPLYDDLLQRTVRTSTQTRKNRLERWRNVDHIFSVVDKEVIRNKKVLLVDDVITTGATLESCALALQNAGCRSVGVVAMAAAK